MKIVCLNPPKFIKKLLRLFRREKKVNEERESPENKG